MSNPSKLDNAILRNLLAPTADAYEARLEDALGEREIAELTLAAITDGVITTDKNGILQYLNPVAERLTGWSLRDARGRSFHAVFHLINPESEITESFPLERCLEHGERLPQGRPSLLVRRDGQRVAIQHTGAPIRDGGNRTIGAVLVFQDVSDRRLLTLRLQHQASHDPLTGLLNRHAFDQHLHRALSAERRATLLLVDLDRFKLVNDSCGHSAGDELLCRVSELLRENLRDEDILARLGADEFGLLFPACDEHGGVSKANRVLEALRHFRFAWQDDAISITATIGVVPVRSAFASVPELISAADDACYIGKSQGRDQVRLYRADDVDVRRHHGEIDWVRQIRRNLGADRFCLYAQRIHPTHRRRDEGERFEILVRMLGGKKRLHAPAAFLRAAERYGLVGAIDRWVVSHTLEALGTTGRKALAGIEMCAINLSGLSLSEPSFLEFMHRELDRHRVVPEKLCFEITETAAVGNIRQVKRLIEELSEIGCRFALDDFGTGVASYGYLKDLPVSFLKIDGEFTKDVLTKAFDRAMIESIQQIASVMGIATVAEAISSRAIADRLTEMGIDYLQGYWLDRPCSLSDLLDEVSDK